MGSIRGHGQQVTPPTLVIHAMMVVHVHRNAVVRPMGQRGVSFCCMQAYSGMNARPEAVLGLLLAEPTAAVSIDWSTSPQ